MEIAVTGRSVLSSAGETALALCENSVLGKKVIQQIDLNIYEKETSSINAGPRELYRIQKLLLIAFLKALNLAELKISLVSQERMGIFLGNSYGIEEFKTEFFRTYKKSAPNLTSPTLFPFTNANSLAAWLAIQTGAKGPNLTFVSGSTSSAEAMLAACDSLIADECDMAFVGGVSVIDNNLSDEFYMSGFRYESAGMLVLEKIDGKVGSQRKPAAILKDCERITVTQAQTEQLKLKTSGSRIDDIGNCFSKDIPVVIYLANDLGDNGFSYNRKNPGIMESQNKTLFLNEIIGNVFDVAGVLGTALSIDLLNLPQGAKWRPFGPAQENILYLIVGNNDTAIKMLINRL